MNGLAGFAIPQHRRLALVGDPDRGNVAGLKFRFLQCGFGRRQLRCPNFFGIVLHPAGLRIMLLELLLRDGVNLAIVIEDDAATAGRALI